MNIKRLALLASALVAVAAYWGQPGDRGVDRSPQVAQPAPASIGREESAAADESDASSESMLQQAIRTQAEDVQVKGSGTVIKLLRDDLDGSRHQKFLLRIPSGQVLLVAHNIDLAPRLDDLRTGDVVDFYGEYVWNEKGGLIHWTHHDPAGQHPAGWLKHAGREYR